MPNRSVLNVGKRTLVAKSCSGCGHFKMASEFRKLSSGKLVGYYNNECRSCHHKSARKANLRTNHRSMEKATRTRASWTESEVKILWKLTEQGKSREYIAHALGRTVNAVGLAKLRYPKKETS